MPRASRFVLQIKKKRRFKEMKLMSKKFLMEKYNIDISEYDLIIGYRADDSYFRFAEDFLNNSISVEKLERAMYLGKLREQIVLKSEKAFEQLDKLYASVSNLKKQREKLGVSQSMLSKKSGTSLRTLQAYEQRAKDINKASVGTVKNIAETLGCNIEEII